jgi:glycerol-3-phosphate acyltransferase PlsY
MPAYQLILMTIGAYTLGSVPFSYIAGRLLKGIDIRDYGSGVSSGSNVWHSVSRWATIPVGICDLLKGAIPVAVAYPVLDFPIWAQGLVGIAAIAGHSWSIFLGFNGGRGFATMIGVILVFAPWELIVFTFASLSLFFALKNSPLSMLIAAVLIVLASIGLPEGPLVKSTDDPVTITWCLLGVLLLLIGKRLLAESSIPKDKWKSVMLYRFLFDRDTRNREEWIYRAPDDT